MTEKVAFITDRYWPCRGGVEQASFSLASRISSKFPVKIINQNMSEGSLYNSFSYFNRNCPPVDPSGNPIVYLKPQVVTKVILSPLLLWQLPYVRNLNAPRLFDYLYVFYKLAFYNRMKRNLQEIRIVHNFSTSYPARLATEICSKNNIPLIHSPFVHFDKWGDSKCQMNAYCKADNVICPTYSHKKEFLSRSQSKCNCTVIPPVTPDPAYPPESERPVKGRYFLFLGRREPHKGLTFLIDAFCGSEHSIALVIAGPGEQVVKAGTNIIDLGEVDDNKKRHLLANCEFLCVPSTDETFGIVYTEAMSYKKPVIALNVAPVNEIIINHKTGILVKPGDINSLKSAVSTLENSEIMRFEMGEAAYKRYEENYSAEKILAQIMKLYNQLLSFDSI